MNTPSPKAEVNSTASIPAYARSFSGACRPGEPFYDTDEIDYSDLPQSWIQEARIDARLCAASYVDYGPAPIMNKKGKKKEMRARPKGKGIVSFDVPKMVRQKAEHVKRYGLGGYSTGPLSATSVIGLQA
ncbi:hypothetical protein GQX73_g2227 [Xylaria multiplex]|uniref:Uncharacterized protein n=1 Tax=Xylaria multiplex TaxID=323545 RepID=A0A7C8ISP7_9PEZI|nr:hypothetical protein GQX73_g2227 [Xylaria multiplex]